MRGKFFIGAFVLSLVSVACTTPPESGKSPSSEAETKKGKTEQTVGIGEPVGVGEVGWIVNDAQRTQLLQSQFGPFGNNKQGNFVVVNFGFLNHSSQPITLNSAAIMLIDERGREFQMDPTAFEYVPPEKLIFLEQVNPGVIRNGIAVFTVAPDASGFRLRVGDAKIFSAGEAYIDLGF
jgi:hypothetical protein